MRKLILILFLILTPNSIIFSQSFNGSIQGKILNASTQSPVPFASIVIIGTNFGAQSAFDGTFSINNISPGSYQLKASAIGYKAVVKTDVMVTNSKPAYIHFDLPEEAVELQAITVTSEFFSKEPADVNSVRTFSYEEIRRSAGGFEDVIRALSVLPGVAQASAGRNDLVVRGGAPSENLYLLNGIAIPNINHFGTQGATGGPISYVNLDFVEQTSFATGAFPVNYGDKLSSVLRIDLREGRKDRIGGKVNIAASQFGVNLEGPISEKGSFIFSARRSYLDFIFKAAGFGFVPEYYDVLTKADMKLDDKNSIGFLFLGAFDNVKYFNETADKRFDNSRILGSNQNQYGTGITFQHLFNKGFLKMSLSRNFTDYDSQQRDSLLNPLFLNKSREGEDKLKAEIVSKLSTNSEISFGGEAQRIKTDFNVKLPTFRTSFGETLSVDSLNKTGSFYKYSLFVNYTRNYSGRMIFNFGLRSDYFDGLNEKYAFSPRFSASYKFDDKTSVNFSTGLFYQSPSYIWLIATESNRNLKPVKVLQYVLGLEHLLSEDLQTRVEVFYKKYSDYPSSMLRPYLVLANTGAGYAGSDDNFASFGLEPLNSGGSGFSRGVEFSMQKKISQEMPFYGILSLTYNQTRFTALDGIERNGSYDQPIILSASGGYQFNNTWEGSMKFRYATGSPYTPYEPDGTQLKDKYLSARLSPTHSLDIRIDKKWFFEKLTLITYIDIQNVYGQKNIAIVRWDKRNNVEKRDSAIGILPSIGVSLEF